MNNKTCRKMFKSIFTRLLFKKSVCTGKQQPKTCIMIFFQVHKITGDGERLTRWDGHLDKIVKSVDNLCPCYTLIYGPIVPQSLLGWWKERAHRNGSGSGSVLGGLHILTYLLLCYPWTSSVTIQWRKEMRIKET